MIQQVTLNEAINQVRVIHFDDLASLSLKNNTISILIKGSTIPMAIRLGSNADLKKIFEAFNTEKRDTTPMSQKPKVMNSWFRQP